MSVWLLQEENSHDVAVFSTAERAMARLTMTYPDADVVGSHLAPNTEFGWPDEYRVVVKRWGNLVGDFTITETKVN